MATIPGIADFDDQQFAALAESLGIKAEAAPPFAVRRIPKLGAVEQLLTKMDESPAPEAVALAFQSGLFLRDSNPHLARALNERAYENQVRLQGETRIDKGGTLFQVGLCHSAEGDQVAAFRWQLLAFLEDCWSSSGPIPALPAYEFLRTHFAVPPRQLESLHELVVHARSSVETDEFAALARLHPEMLFALVWPEASVTAPIGTSTHDFVNWVLFEKLLQLTKQKATKALVAGKRAEMLVAVYLSSAASFEVRSRVWTRTQEYEFDVLVSSALANHPFWSGMGPYFASECKNWDGAVGVDAVNHFAAKLRFHGMSFGVLVTRKGTSGRQKKAYYQNAQKTLLKLAQAQGIFIGAWDEAQLDHILRDRIGPLAAVRRTYEQVRFELSNARACGGDDD